MEHSLSQIHSPWRTATLVAAAVALLELVALVVLAVVLLADPVSHQVQKAAEAKAFAPVQKPKRAVPAAQPKLTRGETSVIVLNGNGRSGAAAAGAERVRAFGYTIGTVGNAPRRDVTRTIVMFRKGYRPEAVRLAKDLKVKIVAPLDGLTTRDMLGAHLALVLGD